MLSLPFDPNKTPYEMFIDKTYNHVIRDTPIHCVTKDILLRCLNSICDVENSELYDVYLFGKLNSSCPFPTWDVDIALVRGETDDQILLDVMTKIKEIGLTNNINMDIKYLTDINIIATGYINPDKDYIIKEKCITFNLSTSLYELHERTKTYKVNDKRTETFKDFVYYTPLLVKSIGKNKIDDNCIEFISDGILPQSSLMGSGKFDSGPLRSWLVNK